MWRQSTPSYNSTLTSPTPISLEEGTKEDTIIYQASRKKPRRTLPSLTWQQMSEGCLASEDVCFFCQVYYEFRPQLGSIYRV